MTTSIAQLEDALTTLTSTTTQALSTSHALSRRTRHLSTLTTPASETSSSLTQASTNLTSTLALLRDAREKFDTVVDCEPSIERLYRGAKEAAESRERRDHPNNIYNVPNDTSSLIDNKRYFNDDDTMTLATLNGTVIGLTEQDVYAAADSLEIIRDAHMYFQKRPKWTSSKTASTGLQRVHQLGVDGMCTLIKCHLLNAGPAIRMKRGWALKRNADDATIDSRGASTIATNTTFGTRRGGGAANPHAQETARDTRERLSAALQNRDLMKSVGEYEESLPLDTRTVRELRAMFECLGGNGCYLNPATTPKPDDIMKALSRYQAAAGKVSRTEKIGSGHYTQLAMTNIDTGYHHLNAYTEARRSVAYQSMQLFYKNLRSERKKEWDRRASSGGDIAEVESGELDSSARDAVRCLEHAMVIVAGEKSIYRCVVSPTSSHTHDTLKIPLEYKYALVASYSSVCGIVVDRVLDIIELFFVKDASLRNPTSKSAGLAEGSGLDGDSATDGGNAVATPSIRFAASASAAGLRILDAVRMLGPSLAKLCEMASDKMQLRSAASSTGSTMSKENSASLASNLCIAIHRMTVKNAGKALENLALAVKNDPIDGEKFRPKDARVAAISSDVVRAIRLVSPFVNAYKSVTKRR
jgi:exocyst complex protein 7